MEQAASHELILYTKIFGERNTGTNYLEHLVRTNFSTELLRGGMEEIWHLAPTLLVGKPQIEQSDEVNRIYDADARRILDSDFGWKHSAPQLQRILSSSHSNNTLFIMIVKHPYFWLRSLHDNPYYPGYRKEELCVFAERRMQIFDRDGLTEEWLEPAKILERKLRSYIVLAESNLNTLVIRYEDLLEMFEFSMDRISKFLPRKGHGTYNNLNKSAKASVKQRSLDFYKRKYNLNRASVAVDHKTKIVVRKSLSAEVLEWFGYEL